MWDNIRMETPAKIVRVADVAWLDKQGKTARGILGSYPDLTLSQVHAALLYFYEHRSGMTNKHYAIVVERAEGNYSAYAPDLPGVVAAGDTSRRPSG